MKKYIVSIPKPWQSFEFYSMSREEAVNLFERSTVYEKFASLYVGNKDHENRIVCRENGKLLILENRGQGYV